MGFSQFWYTVKVAVLIVIREHCIVLIIISIIFGYIVPSHPMTTRHRLRRIVVAGDLSMRWRGLPPTAEERSAGERLLHLARLHAALLAALLPDNASGVRVAFNNLARSSRPMNLIVVKAAGRPGPNPQLRREAGVLYNLFSAPGSPWGLPPELTPVRSSELPFAELSSFPLKKTFSMSNSA